MTRFLFYCHSIISISNNLLLVLYGLFGYQLIQNQDFLTVRQIVKGHNIEVDTKQGQIFEPVAT